MMNMIEKGEINSEVRGQNPIHGSVEMIADVMTGLIGTHTYIYLYILLNYSHHFICNK